MTWRKMAGTGTLSTNQRRALVALLSHGTIAEAAETAGLGERTVQRYLRDPVFKAELHARQDEIISATTAALAGLSQEAIKALGRSLAILTDQAAAVVADFIEVDDKGGWRLDLAKADDAGLLHLVKKLWTDKEGHDRLELHDAQSAADKLGRLALAIVEARRKATELDDLAQRVEALEKLQEGKR